MKKLEIIYKKIEELKAYENNPRENEDAIKYVKESISEFGFQVPCIIDTNNVIVCGHTRVAAAKELEMEEVPCIVADDLTEEQLKVFRIADNKVAEKSEWDTKKLFEELNALEVDFDMSLFGFSEIDDIDITDLFEEEEELEKTKEDKKKKIVVCPDCGEEIEICE